MRETYVLEDLIQTLILLEDKGSALYTALIDKQVDEKARKLFAILAAQELKHKKLYEGMLHTLKVAEEVDEDYQAYIDVLLKGTIAFLSTEVDASTFQEAFDIAVRLEKDTLLFLSEVQLIIPRSAHPLILEVAKEERKHLQLLYAYMAESRTL